MSAQISLIDNRAIPILVRYKIYLLWGSYLQTIDAMFLKIRVIVKWEEKRKNNCTSVTPKMLYSHFNKELRQVFLAITRVWCRKSFPSLFEMTINRRWSF